MKSMADSLRVDDVREIVEERQRERKLGTKSKVEGNNRKREIRKAEK